MNIVLIYILLAILIFPLFVISVYCLIELNEFIIPVAIILLIGGCLFFINSGWVEEVEYITYYVQLSESKTPFIEHDDKIIDLGNKFNKNLYEGDVIIVKKTKYVHKLFYHNDITIDYILKEDSK